MRKASILLSALASFALSGNIVNDLEIEQINKVRSNSTFSNDVNVSQGTTNITDNSNIEDVHILQKDGNSAGNLIENTTINGNNSELHQGLTSINRSTLHYAELTSKNKVNGITVTGGKSTITQGNLIIGGDSNVSGIAGSSGGDPWGGGGTGENLEITQTNLLENSHIDTSILHQGLTTINDDASVSITFKLNQENTISRVTSGDNNIGGSSKILQGITDIAGGDTTFVVQYIENEIVDVSLDGSRIRQSSIKLKDSTVSNINTGNGTNVDDKNLIEDITATNGSTVTQSSIDINASSVSGLYKSEIGSAGKNLEYHNLLKDVDNLNNSHIQQSIFRATNNSDILNVEYVNSKNVNSGAWIEANNHIQDLNNIQNSKLNQDVTELDNAKLKETDIDRLNTMWTVSASSSELNQNRLIVTKSTLENSTLNQDNLIYDLTATNTNLSQGSTIITD